MAGIVLWACSAGLHFSKNAMCGSLFPGYDRDHGFEYFWLIKCIFTASLHITIRRGVGKFLDKINPKRHEQDWFAFKIYNYINLFLITEEHVYSQLLLFMILMNFWLNIKIIECNKIRIYSVFTPNFLCFLKGNI